MRNKQRRAAVFRLIAVVVNFRKCFGIPVFKQQPVFALVVEAVYIGISFWQFSFGVLYIPDEMIQQFVAMLVFPA